MNDCIDKLIEIKKDEMDERSFYEQVLSSLQTLEGVSLTDENALQLKETLEGIGCVSQDVWRKEKQERGEIVKDVPPIWDGLKNAEIETAVNIVSQLLSEPSNIKFSLYAVFEWGGPQEWVKNSIAMREKAQEPKENNMGNEIKKGIIEAGREMGVTKEDILTKGKRMFDRAMNLFKGKDTIQTERDEK